VPPIPNASVRTAAAVNAGEYRNCRNAYRTLPKRFCISTPWLGVRVWRHGSSQSFGPAKASTLRRQKCQPPKSAASGRTGWCYESTSTFLDGSRDVANYSLAWRRLLADLGGLRFPARRRFGFCSRAARRWDGWCEGATNAKQFSHRPNLSTTRCPHAAVMIHGTLPRCLWSHPARVLSSLEMGQFRRPSAAKPVPCQSLLTSSSRHETYR